MTVTQSTELSSTQPASVMGGEVREFPWSWQGQSLKLVYETLGQGTPVLL